MSAELIRALEVYISQDSLKSAILISILSVWVLIGLFTYLNRYTKRRYFTLWTGAWLFYAIWLSLNYGLLKISETPVMVMSKQWCVGVAATFLLWGSFRFLRMQVRQTLLGLFIGFLLVWSYIGAFYLENRYWIQVPIFGLIGLASLLTSICFFSYRRRKPFIGATLLAFGFFLWGSYFASYPFFQFTDELSAAGFFISGVLQLFIAVSMIILVLEEVRNANQFAFKKIRSQKQERDALKTRVVSTEERYRSLFDQASEGIIITNGEFRILELNATAQRLLGITQTESSQQQLPMFCQPPHPSCIPPKGNEWFGWVRRLPHIKVIQKNGASVLAEIDGAPIEFEGKPAYQFFFREVTERTRLEQQLRQAEKLSALGQMISGVAHELNNPLAVIKGYVELILAHHKLSPQTRADLEKVSSESARAAKLVRQFLAFSREEPAHREMVNFNELINRIAELRDFGLRESNVELHLDLFADLPKTYADPDQVQQIINNLLTNAIQAMAQDARGRRIRVSTRRKESSIEIAIEDSGPGVPSDIEQKIFEPFFTTKEVGTGTGLGLSIAHSIMTEHRGRISYHPSSLGGAAFVLEFPLVQVQETESDTPAVLLRNLSPLRTSARILVLDDERAIAELLCEMLGMLGHQTTMCLSPVTALELIGKEDFDLVISDFRMPVMNGQEFHRRAAELNRGLAERMIFLTGDVITEETHAFLQTSGNPHLAKPFQLSILEQVINQSLSSLNKVSSN